MAESAQHLQKTNRFSARIAVRLRASEREALIAFARQIDEPVGEVIRLALAAYIGRPFTERKQKEE